nr:hypothetical protein [Nostoc sp. CHAB 5715]
MGSGEWGVEKFLLHYSLLPIPHSRVESNSAQRNPQVKTVPPPDDAHQQCLSPFLTTFLDDSNLDAPLTQPNHTTHPPPPLHETDCELLPPLVLPLLATP